MVSAAAGHTEIQGFPHVGDLTVGESVEAKIDHVWQPATVAWIGEWVVYVTAGDGARHKVSRFASELRKLEGVS